jgi:acyl-CoA synthetase (AMP-forming)/AMP-acid ligase II
MAILSSTKPSSQACGQQSLRALTVRRSSPGQRISDEAHAVSIADIASGAGLDNLNWFRDKTVLLATTRQLATVLSLIALDGVARRMLLATPDLMRHAPALIEQAAVDAVITDRPEIFGTSGIAVREVGDTLDYTVRDDVERSIETSWILFTSGTTGRPKGAIHTLATLAGPLDDGLNVVSGAVWSTFYDIRRYGGLQIMLRALLGGGSLVLSSSTESFPALLTRLGESRVTHVSGTPSHWRKALMSGSIAAISPAYVRLSGEIADQAILDHLRRAFPHASIAHAYASTEAGVAFDVRDGKAGFPASLVGDPNAKAEIRVIDGTLRIRSNRVAHGYIGQPFAEDDGFVDTGDLVLLENGRYYFKGRREGVINVGGRKVYPEEVEAVLTQHPAVRLARVRPRNNPVTGALVAADVVLKQDAAWSPVLKSELIEHCRQRLASWQVPASLSPAADVELTAAGKVARNA